MADEPTIIAPKFPKDLSGYVFGRLTVVCRKGVTAQRNARWQCQCECGSVCFVGRKELIRGNTKSCGCFRREVIAKRISKRAFRTKEHPLEYSSYSAMINRCHNPIHPDFQFYGARGRKVCARWRFGDGQKSGFECFVEDMPPRRSRALTLDRYPDNDGGYEPSNCRWATKQQQSQNR